MGKPDWKDAPDGAKWLAQDKIGTWYWFKKKKPVRLTQTWFASGGDWIFAGRGLANPAWTETLERRP